MDQQESQTSTPSPTPGGEKKDYTKWIIIGAVVLVVLYVAQSMLSPQRMMERGIERAMEQAGGGDIDIDINPDGDGEANFTIKGEDGETYEVNAGGSVKLPDSWPKDVPLMNDAKITYAQTMAAAQGGGNSVAYITKASVESVVAYYSEELPKNGWTIGLTSQSTDGAMVTATRGENGEGGVMVYVGSSPEGTTVTMTVSMRE